MKLLHFNIIRTVILIIGLVAVKQSVQAQLYPAGIQYFYNPYLGNPAMAGVGSGLNLNLSLRKQWSNINGSPLTQNITGDYAMTNKAAIGVSLFNDKAGLFKRTRVVGSFAYHLPLGGKQIFDKTNQALSFGLSLGVMNQRVNIEDVKGDLNDIIVGNYNDNETYADGDFGIAYTSNGLQVQASLLNMKMFLNKDVRYNSSDYSTFFSSVSYKFPLSGDSKDFEIEPKVCFHGVRGFNNIVDAGVRIGYKDNRLNIFGLYHSSKNASFGFKFNYQSMSISSIYTSPTSEINQYTGGSFEISIGIIVL